MAVIVVLFSVNILKSIRKGAFVSIVYLPSEELSNEQTINSVRQFYNFDPNDWVTDLWGCRRGADLEVEPPFLVSVFLT